MLWWPDRSWTPELLHLVNANLKELTESALSASIEKTFEAEHGDRVLSVAWDTSGTRLATGSWDKSARIFSEPVDLGVRKFLHADVWTFPFKPENAIGGIPRLRISLVHLVPRLCRFTSTSWKIHRTNTGPQRSKTEGLVHTPLG